VHCDRYDAAGKVREVRIPVTSNASFEEVLDGNDDHDSAGSAVSIDQLARLLTTNNKLLVKLTQPTDDLALQPGHSQLLPFHTRFFFIAMFTLP